MGPGSAASWLAPYAGQPPRGTARRSLTNGKGWFRGTRQRGELACLICGAAAARNCQTGLAGWERLVFWDQAASDTEGAPGLHFAAWAHEASCALSRCAAAGVRFARGFRGAHSGALDVKRAEIPATRRAGLPHMRGSRRVAFPLSHCGHVV